MLQPKCCRNKAFIICLLFIFLFTSNCATYRNMRSTGDYTTIKKERLEDEFAFRMIQSPQLKSPFLVVEFDKYPVYDEHRNVVEKGEKRVNYILAWLALTAGGLAIMSAVQKDSTKWLIGAIGGFTFLYGFTGIFYRPITPWKPTSKYSLRKVRVKDEDHYQLLSNEKVKVFFPTIGDKYDLVTNEKGQISIDLSEVVSFVKEGASLDLKFYSEKFTQASHTFKIPSSFFSDLKSYYASIRPPDLKTELGWI